MKNYIIYALKISFLVMLCTIPIVFTMAHNDRNDRMYDSDDDDDYMMNDCYDDIQYNGDSDMMSNGYDSSCYDVYDYDDDYYDDDDDDDYDDDDYDDDDDDDYYDDDYYDDDD